MQCLNPRNKSGIKKGEKYYIMSHCLFVFHFLLISITWRTLRQSHYYMFGLSIKNCRVQVVVSIHCYPRYPSTFEDHKGMIMIESSADLMSLCKVVVRFKTSFYILTCLRSLSSLGTRLGLFWYFSVQCFVFRKFTGYLLSCL